MRTRNRIAGALMPLALLAACGQAASDHQAAARSAYSAGDYAAARREAIAALEAEPRDPALLELLVRSLLRMSDPDGAESAVRRLERAGVKDARINRFKAEIGVLRGEKGAAARLGQDGTPDAWRIRAMARIAESDPEGAITAFEKGMAAGDDANLLVHYARFQLGVPDLAGAEALVERLRSIAPKGFETLMLSGQLAAQRGRHAAALAEFRKASALLPGRHEPLLASAEMLQALERLPEATKLVEQAAALAPRAADVRSMRLQLLSEKGEWAKIRDMLQSSEAALDPRSADGLTYGEALLNLGHPEQARVLFRRSVLLAPGNRYARMMLARAELAAGDPDDAWYTLEDIVEGVLVYPHELEIAEQAARAAGWEDDAQRLKARRLSPAFARQVSLAGQAEGAVASGDWTGAITAYRALMTLGEDADLLKRLAFACSRAGQHAEAVAQADRALALAPDSPEMLFMAAKVRLAGKIENAKAISLLERAAEGDPRNSEIRGFLAKAKAAAG